VVTLQNNLFPGPVRFISPVYFLGGIDFPICLSPGGVPGGHVTKKKFRPLLRFHTLMQDASMLVEYESSGSNNTEERVYPPGENNSDDEFDEIKRPFRDYANSMGDSLFRRDAEIYGLNEEESWEEMLWNEEDYFAKQFSYMKQYGNTMGFITISHMDAALDVYFVTEDRTTQFIASWTPDTSKGISDIIRDLWLQMDKVDKFFHGESETISF
jgi:hypothetical protein